jgi:dienelactone hydrolase
MERKFLIFITALLMLSFSVTWFFLNSPSEETYSVQNGLLSYSNRPQIQYSQEIWNETEERIIYKVWFPSHGNATVYGLLAVPKLDGSLPAFFILPGATVTKEGELGMLGDPLNEMGYITLTLDQRGHGETGGYIPSFDMDYTFWAQGEESIQHKFVYDGLRAFDLLYQLPGIDRSRIYAAGESMGGNYAMIAAGIEPRIRGLLLVSSSGFKFAAQPDPRAAEYLKSIMGDSYIAKLSPRPFLMLHSEGDTVVRLEDAQDTFNKAGQPKTLLTISSDTHSYTPQMRDILEQGLEGW